MAAIAYTMVNVTLRSAAPTIDPVLGSLLRLLPVAGVAWAVVLLGGARELRPALPTFIGWPFVAYLLLGGSASFVIGNVLNFQALVTGGLGVTIGGIQAGSVLGGLWIGLLVLGERPWREQVAGAGLIVGGLAGIAIAQTQALLELWWLGLLFALGAGTTYALANALTRIVMRQRSVLFVTLAVSSLRGALPLAVLVAARAAAGEVMAADAASVAAVLLAGVANAVALAGLALAVRSAPVATVNTIASATIVFSFIASVTLFGEVGSLPMILGIALVTGGIILAQVRRGGRGGAPAPVSEVDVEGAGGPVAR